MGSALVELMAAVMADGLVESMAALLADGWDGK